jgi:signal transduction histidine kinase
LVLLFCCSKSKRFSIRNSKDSTLVFIQKAENIKTPYHLRVIYTKKAVANLLRQTNDSMNSDRLIKMSRNFYKLNSWNELKETSRLLKERNTKKRDDYFIAQSYRWTGVFYENMSLNDSAYYCYLKAEKIFKKLHNYEQLCEIYRDEALIKYYTNDYLGSDEVLIKALKIAKKLNLIDKQVLIYMSLGSNASSLNEFDKAYEFFERALSLINNFKLGNDLLLTCLNHIGFVFYQKEEFYKSITIYEKAIQSINSPHENLEIYLKVLDNFAQSKVKLKSYEGVESLYLKTSFIRDSLNIDFGRNSNALFLSKYYELTNQNIKAKQFAQESYNLSKSYRNAGDILLSLKQLTKVDTINALKYCQDYIRISDSMQILERVTRNKFAKIAYETEEITNEKEQAIKQKWIFLSIAVLLLLVGILLFIIIHQRTKQKEMRLLQDQQKANEEIYQLIQNQQTKIDEGRQIEKKRIAQDLHDGIMNRLASTRLNLHVIAEKPSLENMKKCLPFIDGIQDIEKEIRNIAHDLNSNAFANKTSFIAVVESFIEEKKSISSSKYHLEIDMSINWEQIEGYKKIHLFRILQEAIQNIEKHAKAKNVIVSILKAESQFLIEIFDDGNGFSLKRKKKGIGLQNIFSRAKCCNGKAEVKSKENEGTTVIVRIPI